MRYAAIRRHRAAGALLAALFVSWAAVPAADAATFQVFGKVYGAAALAPEEEAPVNPLTGRPPEQIVGAENLFATGTRSMVRVRLFDAGSGVQIGSEYLVTLDGGYFLSFTHPGATRSVRFEVWDAVTPDQLMSSADVTVSSGANLRLVLAPGGELAVGGSIPHPAGNTFVFTRVGKIELTEIDAAGFANVSPAASSALKIPLYEDAPFGGDLFLFGAFSAAFYPTSGSGAYCYKIEADGTPITDPLHKVRYTVNTTTGTVTADRIKVGPVTVGLVSDCYRLTPVSDVGASPAEQVFWSFPDLLALWPTAGLSGPRTLTARLYRTIFPCAGCQQILAPNANDSLTVHLDGQPITLRFDEIEQRSSGGVTQVDLLTNACDIVQLSGGRQFFLRFTAHHPGGFLREYRLRRIANDGAAAVWASGTYTPAMGGTFEGTPVGGTEITKLSADFGTPCAYRFILHAVARTTDGYHYIRRRHSEKAYYVQP